MTEKKETKSKIERNKRKVVTGVVMSDKTNKTRVVGINRLVMHPRYGKVLKRRTRVYVHDENNVSKLGDTVEVMSTRPISKMKRWRLVRVVRQGARIDKPTAKETSS